MEEGGNSPSPLTLPQSATGHGAGEAIADRGVRVDTAGECDGSPAKLYACVWDGRMPCLWPKECAEHQFCGRYGEDDE